MPVIRAETTANAIDLGRILAELSDPGHGAQVLFTGTVRDLNDGKRVLAVTYDVLSPLAERTFEAIGAEAEEACGDAVRIVVVHRRGRLAVGETSVAVGASSPHRAEAFEAARRVIEEIKVRAPVWKKEHYEDGETEWLRGHALCGRGHGHDHGRGAGGGPLHANGPR